MNFLANLITGAVILFHAFFGGAQSVPQSTPVGAAVPQAQALFETSLQSSITTNATSATMVSGTDFAGNSLNGYYCFTIDSGQPNVEFVCGNASGTALTALTRGVNPALGISANTGLQQTHRRGADVKQTDAPYISLYSQIFNGSTSIPGTLFYQSLPVFISSTQIVDKQYVDQVATSGAADAGIGSKGLVAIGTPLSAPTSTDGSSILYTVPSLQYYASSSLATTSVVVTNGSGQIDPSFVSGTAYSFTNPTLNGTTTVNNIVVNGTTPFGHIKVFIASSTFVVPTGTTLIFISGVGPGGGGSAATANGASGGGGSGSWITMFPTSTTPGSSIVVTIGQIGQGGISGGATSTSGGATTVGNWLTLNGGERGLPIANAGAGGATTTILAGITFTGNSVTGTVSGANVGGAGANIISGSFTCLGGAGGSGAGGPGTSSTVGYGCGGGGGGVNGGTTGNGGNGTPSLVFFEY